MIKIPTVVLMRRQKREQNMVNRLDWNALEGKFELTSRNCDDLNTHSSVITALALRKTNSGHYGNKLLKLNFEILCLMEILND